MAKKARTPPPPRRPVQAPQQRSIPRSPRDSRTFLYVLAFAGLGVILLGGVLALLAFGGSSESGLAATMRKAGCTYETYPSQGGKHVTRPPKGFVYNSVPATSGPMTEETVIWGIYEDPVNQVSAVHNLEHSGIVIQYDPRVSASTLADLRSFYTSDPNGLLVAPLPALGGKQIALAAWTRLAKCKSFDKKAFEAFVDANRYGGKAPEKAPEGSLRPGQG